MPKWSWRTQLLALSVKLSVDTYMRIYEDLFQLSFGRYVPLIPTYQIKTGRIIAMMDGIVPSLISAATAKKDRVLEKEFGY